MIRDASQGWVRRMMIVALLGSSPVVAHEEEEARRWTDREGRSFEGVLVKADEEWVRVARADGREFTLKLEALSDEDQEFVRNGLAVKPEVAGPAAAPGMLAGYDPTSANFGADWPRDVRVPLDTPITVIEEDAGERRYVYESPNFRFESDALLRPSLLEKVATMFEAAFVLHREVPLGNRRTRATNSRKFRAVLYETLDAYYAAGNPPGSAGVYRGATDTFETALETLGVKKVGSGYMYDHRGDFHIFFHEITHQLWADYRSKAGIWMVEGFAEYMGLMPFRSGRITVSQQRRQVPDYALGYGRDSSGGRALGKRFTMPRLERFMTMSQEEFYQQSNFNYACGLLLVYFFIELDDGGGKRFHDCFRAMHDGADPEEARKVLLDGRSYEELERQFAAAMRRVGADVSFR